MHLTNAHDGFPPYTYGIAGLLVVAAVGVFIAVQAIRNVPRLVDCCPHPGLDDEDTEPAEVTV